VPFTFLYHNLPHMPSDPIQNPNFVNFQLDEVESDDDEVITVVVPPGEDDFVDYDVSHVPYDPRDHILSVGYGMRDALDLIGEKNPLDVMFTAEMRELINKLSLSYKALHEAKPNFAPVEKSVVLSQLSRATHYRSFEPIFRRFGPGRLDIYIENPTVSFMNCLRNHLSTKGIDGYILYSGRNLKRMDSTWIAGISHLQEKKFKVDCIILNHDTRYLAVGLGSSTSGYLDLLKPTGTLNIVAIDLNVVDGGFVNDVRIVKDPDTVDKSSVSVQFHNRVFEDYRYDKEVTRRYFLSLDLVPDYHDHMSMTQMGKGEPFNTKGEALPDSWKVFGVWIVGRKYVPPLLPLIKESCVVDVSKFRMNKPRPMQHKDLDRLVGLKCFYKEKHDGFPAVAVCQNGNCHVFRVYPNGRFEHIDGGIPGAVFPGMLQLEVLVDNIGTRTYQYIDYDDGSQLTFENRRDAFYSFVTQPVASEIRYNYKDLTYENFLYLMDPEREGAIVQLAHAVVSDHFNRPISYYVKHDPTIDVTYTDAIKLDYLGDEFFGVHEIYLNGMRLGKPRPDKFKSNSMDEIDKVKKMVVLSEALITLWQNCVPISEWGMTSDMKALYEMVSTDEIRATQVALEDPDPVVAKRKLRDKINGLNVSYRRVESSS